MNFEHIEIDKITIEKSVKTSHDIKLNNKYIELWTPKLYVPFGLETKFNNHFLNLELKGDNYVILFEYFIETFETKLIELLNIQKEEFNSQLRYTKLNSMLYTKVYEKYKKIITQVKDKNGNFINIFDITNDIYIRANLIIDKLWFINNKYYYKFKLKEIIIE